MTMQAFSRSTRSPLRFNRRQILQSAVAGGLLSVAERSWAAPSERIRLGVIGLGSRGYNLVDALMSAADAQIVAVCDVDEHHHRDRPWGQGPKFGRGPGRQRVLDRYEKQGRGKGQGGVEVTAYGDFRKLCDRGDLDAVMVATPDHWHAACTILRVAPGVGRLL